MLQQWRKFFKPLYENIHARNVFLRSIIYPSFASCASIATIEIMKRSIDAFESKHIDIIRNYIIALFIVLIIWIVVRTVSKNRGWPEIRPYYQNYFSQKYLQKYIQLDNTKMEGFGTGKILHIMKEAIHSRTYSIADISTKAPMYIVK